jgi:F420-0:gamma-glutamyl ligase-like protein
MNTRWIRSLALPALAIGIILFSFGCVRTSSTERSATPVATGRNDATPSLEMAREAARIAVAIEKEPKRMTEILEAHSKTPEAFQELLYKIAQDPELTEAYEAARTDASS